MGRLRIASMKRELFWSGGLIIAMYCLMPEQVTAFGTAIAAIRVPTKTVIAADSRVVDGNGKRMPDECKIRVVADTVYTAHGMSTHSLTGFDLVRLVSADLRRPGDLGSVAARIAKSVVGPLTEALTDMRKTNQAAFKRATTGAAVGVILARHEAGAPQLAYVRLVTRADASNAIHIESEIRVCPGPECLGGIAAVWVSPSEDRLAFQRAHPEYWKEDLPKVATAFVQGEIDRSLLDVGPPIDVVQVVGGRIVWIKRKNGCDDER
jgi:hypothetical protein